MKRSIPFYLVIFIAVRTAINTMVRMVYPFLPVLSRGLGVSIGMLSLGITLRQASAIVAPFLASVGDSYGRKAGMLFGMAMFTAGAALILLWPTYPAFVLMLILGIMASYVFVPTMQAFLSDRVPYARRGLVLGTTEFSWSMAFILGVPIAGYLINRYGWQGPFPWLVGVGLLGLVVLAVVLPYDMPQASERPSLLRNLAVVFRSPSARAAFVFALALGSANELVNVVFGVWLEDAFKVQIAALAAASAVVGISELSGEGAASLLSDWLGKHRSTSAGVILNLLAALALPLLGRSLLGAMAGLFLIYLTFEFTIVCSLPLASEILPAARATLMAIFVASFGLGRAFSDTAATWLYQWGKSLGGPTAGILPVIAVAALVDVAALIFLRLVRTQTADGISPPGLSGPPSV